MGKQGIALQQLGRNIAQVAVAGRLTGRPVQIRPAQHGAIVGPRAGVLLFAAGLVSGDVLSALGRSDCAMLRQLVPWQFIGNPTVSMQGRYIRVEAGWPGEWAKTMVRLSDLNTRAIRRGAWAVGLAETGQTVTCSLHDRSPSYLVSGMTGSGKSVALRSAVFQLAQNGQDRLVLCDGKFGESLGVVSRLPGVVGPVATDAPEIRAALGWVCVQMRRRYESGDREGRIIVVYDEFQRFSDDSVISSLLAALVSQGRAAGIHCLLATQHPSLRVFGNDTTRRNMAGRLALRVGDYDASRVAVGDSSPRADWLLGGGDTYAITVGHCIRTQGVYTDEQDYACLLDGHREFDEWPEFQPEAIGHDLPADTVNWAYTGDELATAIIAASEGEGRPAMVRRMVDSGMSRPGAERAIRLLQLGRETVDSLRRQRLALQPIDG